jgi:CheY-like chemotaxis protein
MSLVLRSVERRSTLPAPAEDHVPRRYHGRVLVVEDNQDTQNLAGEMLRRLGCTVDLVGDGRQALEHMERARYDLVLMDCHMPNLNGYDATQEIRRRELGNGRHTTIVALSASVLPEERARCVAVGMDDYVAKPFSHRDLERVLTRWLVAAQREATEGAA